MSRKALLFLIILVLSMSLFAAQDKLANIKQKIRSEFPTVAQMSTKQLQGLLSETPDNKILLLDVREATEFNVSHLKNAKLATTMEDALLILRDAPKDKRIVAYCSVGYRSSELAQKLAEQGYHNVYNLEGSIFEWANRGLPVYNHGKPVDKVHPYNWWWGGLLDKEYHPD